MASLVCLTFLKSELVLRRVLRRPVLVGWRNSVLLSRQYIYIYIYILIIGLILQAKEGSKKEHTKAKSQDSL